MRLKFALWGGGPRLEPWHRRCLELLEPVAALVGGADGGSEADLADPSLDFVLKLGPGAAPDTPIAARHGIWSFAHESARAGLPFYREVLEGDAVTWAALLARHDGHGAAILEQGWFRTELRSYASNRERVTASIAAWPARACRTILGGGAAAAPPPADDAACERLRVPPRPFLLATRVAARRLRFAWDRLFSHPQWDIGVLRAPVASLLEQGAYADERVEWFPLGTRQRFLADPFGLARDGRVQVLCEAFDYRTGRGDISTLSWDARGFAAGVEPALEPPFHVSYPFLVEHEREIYCVPESGRAGEVALWRAVEFPRRWAKAAVLLEGFAGVDPTVFRHDGRWWLMCTEMGPDQDVALWAWHAPALEGPWTPHAGNPIKTDVRGARPGGVPFVHGGALYRPSQDCSRHYGWRIVIQRVKTLTPTGFAEEPAAVIEPSARSRYPLGRHTLSVVGDVVLVDGHRRVFVWHAMRAFLRIWAADLQARLRGGGSGAAPQAG